ncbi:hypothetical protein BT69DRAFT_1315388 [Atractiella rhizophila]|nr:hypothetical protein BT69DRAFT_1315388 [Atractiella rhizophila]
MMWTDPLVAKWSMTDPPTSLDESKKKLEKILAGPFVPESYRSKLPYSHESPLNVNYSVVLPDTSTVVGRISLACNIYEPYGVFRPYDIGYGFASTAWGKGYASEAMKAFMEALPEDLRKKATAIVLGNNVKSLAVMRRVGFKETKRDYYPLANIDQRQLEALNLVEEAAKGGNMELIWHMWNE